MIHNFCSHIFVWNSVFGTYVHYFRAVRKFRYPAGLCRMNRRPAWHRGRLHVPYPEDDRRRRPAETCPQVCRCMAYFNLILWPPHETRRTMVAAGQAAGIAVVVSWAGFSPSDPRDMDSLLSPRHMNLRFQVASRADVIIVYFSVHYRYCHGSSYPWFWLDTSWYPHNKQDLESPGN
ncbi:hypothetical protein ACRALDRAFT_209964 [Sodiomyces alcalophilus JCM 7366]|uniref:uncharacterized protein n=1 Tax=Sodiomyces alcalophilus JCM 7366 TaxID=591952 RepID=UPI0039B6C398